MSQHPPLMNAFAVRCKRCRRFLGRSGKGVSNVICSRAECTLLDFPPATVNEDRDGVMLALERAGDIDRATIARVGGITVQRVGQILAERTAP